MDVECSRGSVDRAIMDLARRQHGCVGRWQLLPRGISREVIGLRLRQGRLEELYRGVYLVGAVRSEHTLSQASLLAAREPSALSCFSAARLWNARPYPSRSRPWVTVPHRRRIERPGIHIVRADLEPRDLRMRSGMRVTSPPRTVLDCASLIDDDYELEALVAEMHFLGLASERELLEQIERNPGKRGLPRLRRVLAVEGGPQRTRSGGERAFLGLLRENGFQGYQANSKVFGPELDFVWEDLRFAVEVDGWDGHSSRQSFERDRLKVAELGSRGVQVMPVTGRQLRSDRREVARRLARALRLRRHDA